MSKNNSRNNSPNINAEEEMEILPLLAEHLTSEKVMRKRPFHRMAVSVFQRMGRVVARRPTLVQGLTMLVCLVIASGYFIRGEYIEDVLQLWLKDNGREIKNMNRFHNDWIFYGLGQAILTSRERYPRRDLLYTDPETGDRPFIREMFQLYDAVQALQSDPDPVTNKTYTLSDFCYEPGQPFLAGCLQFQPIDYWDKSLEKALADPDPYATVTEQLHLSIDGVNDQLMIYTEREMVWSGMEFEWGTVPWTSEEVYKVKKVEACMFWFFYDITNITGTEMEFGIKNWEDKFLQLLSRSSTNYTAVAYQLATSATEEALVAVEDDFYIIYGTIAVAFVLHFVITLYFSRNHTWLAAYSSMAMGLSAATTFGFTGWLVQADLVTNFEGDGIMFFLVLMFAMHHYHIILAHYGEDSSIEPEARITSIFVDVGPPIFASILVSVTAYIITIIVHPYIPGVTLYLLAASMALVSHFVTMFFFFGPVLYKHAVIEYEDHCATAASDAAAGKSPRAAKKVMTTSDYGSASGGSAPTTPNLSNTLSYKSSDKAHETILARGYAFLYSLPHNLQRFLTAVVVLSAMGLLVLALFDFSDWNVAVTRGDLTGEDSYVRDYSKVESRYFLDIPMPIDMPMYDVDIQDHANAQKILDLGAAIEASKYINKTNFANFFRDFTFWCSGDATPPQRQCSATLDPNDGLPTADSWIFFAFFIIPNPRYEENYSIYAGDVRLDVTGTCPDNCTINKIRAAKFRGVAVHGALKDYAGQKGTMRNLERICVEDAQDPVKAYSFSEAHPYLQMWEPTERILFFYIPFAIGTCATVTILMFDHLTAAVLLTSFSCVVMNVVGLAFVINEWGFNIVTAPCVLMLVPVAFDFHVHIAYFFALKLSATQKLRAEETAYSALPISLVRGSLPNMLSTLIFAASHSPINFSYFVITEITLLTSTIYALVFMMTVLAIRPGYQLLVFTFTVAICLASFFLVIQD